MKALRFSLAAQTLKNSSMTIKFFTFIAILSMATLSSVDAHGDLHELIEQVNRKLAKDPSNAGLLIERANLYRQHHEFDKALVDLKKAEMIEPKSTDLYILKAKVLSGQGKWKEAVENFDLYLAEMDDSAEAYYLRSVAYEKLGKDAKAANDAKFAINNHKRPPLAYHLHYINVLKKSGTQAQVDKAFQEGGKSCGKLPTYAAAHAKWLVESGRPELATEIYARLRKQNPNLSYNWWVEEYKIWKSTDSSKAENAKAEALQAWNALPERVRNRKAMQSKHSDFLKISTQQ